MPDVSLRIYYLEDALSADDVAFVQEAMETADGCEHIRIPHVLPADLPGWDEQSFLRHQELLRGALRNAGIAKDRGRQIVLVAPRKMYWYSVLIHAVYAETGAYPWLVQTKDQREAIGSPGESRILDTHGLMGFRD